MTEAVFNAGERQRLEQLQADNDALAVQQEKLASVGMADEDLVRAIATSRARLNVLLSLDE